MLVEVQGDRWSACADTLRCRPLLARPPCIYQGVLERGRPYDSFECSQSSSGGIAVDLAIQSLKRRLQIPGFLIVLIAETALRSFVVLRPKQSAIFDRQIHRSGS
jgi:hypothetical protein